MHQKIILLISVLLFWTSFAKAESLSSKLFWNSALPVNYERELQREFSAGGKIQLKITANGSLRAYQNNYPASNPAEESGIRKEAWQIFLKVNTERDEQLTKKQIALLYKFSQTKYGAIWLRELVVLTIEALNKGYLEIDQKQMQYLKDGLQIPLSLLLTGELTEDGLFADNFNLLKVVPIEGVGAFGEGFRIHLGLEGFKHHFAHGGQLVDPMAIISHEFGHTILGDYISGENIEGEARTVRDYENPVRVLNGLAPRKCYTRRDQTIVIETSMIYPYLPQECQLYTTIK